MWNGCEDMNLNELTIAIEEWAKERGLDNADPTKQMLKLYEEAGELSEGMAKGKDYAIIDGIGDMFVVLTILSNQLGFSIQECVQVAYNEIKDRKGKMIDGVYVKQDDLG